jgi:hypothetical protein
MTRIIVIRVIRVLSTLTLICQYFRLWKCVFRRNVKGDSEPKGNFADRHWLSIPTIVKGFHLPSESSDFRFRAVKGNSDDHESP